MYVTLFDNGWDMFHISVHATEDAANARFQELNDAYGGRLFAHNHRSVYLCTAEGIVDE